MTWRKSIRAAAFVVIAVPLLGMDGCAQSKYPLASREEGFVDPYLLGEWYAGYVAENGNFQPEQLHLRVSAVDSELRVRWYDEDQYCDLTGYSTRFKDKKYVNLRLVGCAYWTVTEKTASDFDACPYHIIQYKTFMPRGLAEWIDGAVYDVEVDADTLLASAEAQRGRILLYALMWGGDFRRAIEAGDLDGVADCENCGSEGPCIQSDASKLLPYLFANDASLYENTLRHWAVLVRADDGGAASSSE